MQLRYKLLQLFLLIFYVIPGGIYLSMISCNSNTKFINFLQNEINLSTDDISVVLRHPESENAPFPMLLWQYGLVNIEQLAHIFDWLEKQVL
ncbi:hypothetical protein NIES4071_62090 [Calothrix sp. NIES-4071]|nr:hypothetical protein NIES4071_62090 [Calothrix sp. NIES-4071]BAZ60513.1 hypothetical protein NIES4105_62040 [Calothrix sp. NIES-4105]